jgi:site-specific DNA recombinase
MAADEYVAIYTRISRDQSGEGKGVENQQAECLLMAKKLGLTVYDVYEDNDIGASELTDPKKVREQYLRLLTDARAGRFKHIVAYSNSRITRKMRDLNDLVDLVRNHGVKITTATSGQYNLNTADGIMIAEIMTSVDAAESRRISERQKFTFAANALTGKPKLQRQRPFGWEKDGVTIRESEAAIIREGVKHVIAGKSITWVANEWTKAGYVSAAGKTEWNWTTVHRILIGWRTVGVRTRERRELRRADDSLVMGTWEPIITFEERDAALFALKNHALVKVKQKSWVLSGLVLCGVCGGKMYGALGKTPALTTYQCKTGHNAITAHKLETFTISAVFGHMRERAEREAEGKGLVVPADPLVFPDQKRLDEVSTKIPELLKAYNEGVLPSTIVFPEVSALEVEARALQRAKESFFAANVNTEKLMESSEDIWKSVSDLLISDDLDDQKTALSRELQGVVVKKGERGRAGWGTDSALARLEFMWADGSNPQKASISRGEVPIDPNARLTEEYIQASIERELTASPRDDEH